jgi:hypothetical protein
MLASLSRPRAGLLIRSRCPTSPASCVRRLGRVAYAVYGGRDLRVPNPSREALRRLPWIGFDDDHNYMPGQSWVLELLEGARPGVRVNNWLVLQEAARAGAGLALLPCYLGDDDPALRASARSWRTWPPINGCSSTVTPRLSRVRAVMDALVIVPGGARAQRTRLPGAAKTTRRMTIARRGMGSVRRGPKPYPHLTFQPRDGAAASPSRAETSRMRDDALCELLRLSGFTPRSAR